jgi:pyruvate formate lyase activating enzyme
MSVAEIFNTIEKDLAFYSKDGGITLSGGEPLIHAENVLHLLRLCLEKGIGTAIETCGYFDNSILNDLEPLVDLLLWDVKDTNDERHIQSTGVSNKKIIENLIYADSLGIKTVMRCIMVRGINTDTEHLNALADIWHSLNNCDHVHLIPYHAYGGSKAVAIGMQDNGHTDWIPTKEYMTEAQQYLISKNVTVK